MLAAWLFMSGVGCACVSVMFILSWHLSKDTDFEFSLFMRWDNMQTFSTVISVHECGARDEARNILPYTVPHSFQRQSSTFESWNRRQSFILIHWLRKNWWLVVTYGFIQRCLTNNYSRKRDHSDVMKWCNTFNFLYARARPLRYSKHPIIQGEIRYTRLFDIHFFI